MKWKLPRYEHSFTLTNWSIIKPDTDTGETITQLPDYRGITIFYNQVVYYVKMGGELITSTDLQELKNKIDALLDAITPPPPPPPPPSLNDWYGILFQLRRADVEFHRLLERFKDYGFGTFRLFFRQNDITDTAKTNKILELIASFRYRVVPSYSVMAGYSGTPYTFGSELCREMWSELAYRWKGDERIEAFDICNEPDRTVVDPSIYGATWSQFQRNVWEEYAKITDRIRAVDPSRIVVWCDYNHSPIPAEFERPDVVVAYHPYQAGTFTPAQIPVIVQRAIDTVTADCNGMHRIWMGEIQSWDKFFPKDLRETWIKEVLNQARLNGHGFNYACNSSHVEGISLIDEGGVNIEEAIKSSGYTF